MAKASRTKGVAGEREVAAVWQAAGFEVRGLEASGDHLIVCADGLTFHSEVKRAERWKGREWWEQTTAEAPQGTLPLLAHRANRERWKATLWLDDVVTLARLAARPMPRVHVPPMLDGADRG